MPAQRIRWDNCAMFLVVRRGSANQTSRALAEFPAPIPIQMPTPLPLSPSVSQLLPIMSPSHVDRQNLAMRMSMRLFSRFTNAFSKKAENHEATVALHFMHYNFACIDQTLRVTMAMEATIADHVWTLEEVVGLIA